jgi:hypothetical protein
MGRDPLDEDDDEPEPLEMPPLDEPLEEPVPPDELPLPDPLPPLEASGVPAGAEPLEQPAARQAARREIWAVVGTIFELRICIFSAPKIGAASRLKWRLRAFKSK